ncbi:MAG: type II 3-dehydroquinate dehydratase [Coriobacteriia bacterium]|nr:type II 3-dehydroquinate dehydratase [Coriobacteriia bacterium]
MKMLVLNGPNLNMLGTREPEMYGTQTLDELMAELIAYGHERDVVIKVLTSNFEGELIEALHQAAGRYDGVVFNPAAYTHYSIALRDAVACCEVPVIEVHLTDITAREEFRATSVIAPVCHAQFSGGGIASYKRGIDALIDS